MLSLVSQSTAGRLQKSRSSGLTARKFFDIILTRRLPLEAPRMIASLSASRRPLRFS
jgi:hypothetical protein